MENALNEILQVLREAGSIDQIELAALIRRHNRDIRDVAQHLSKKRLMRFYLNERKAESDWWKSQNFDKALDDKLVKTLQVKPRRTASGVATITVVSKPMPCSGNCLFCPNDVRMPKSYLSDEPACQRAERNFFDPYLQVASRMKALIEMGHETDKVEIIVLGGSWTDYPAEYQTWFATELFRALNDSENMWPDAALRREAYRSCGIQDDAAKLKEFAKPIQDQISQGLASYNQAYTQLYGASTPWSKVAAWQTASFDELFAAQRINESAAHRMVGLVFETRPDAITVDSLTHLRKLGATKVQVGIQTLDKTLMEINGRAVSRKRLEESFELLRLFGFKIHAHFMLNLAGATPESDKQDYLNFIHDPSFIPDEVKLYPCVLVEGTGLEKLHTSGEWKPYEDDVLINTLAHDVIATPPHMRISRMIRDISAHDIKAGNKKTNLRQLVESKVGEEGLHNREIRMREISVGEVDANSLQLDCIEYDTAVSSEYFLQWITPEGRIAGFLRLSLPLDDAIATIPGLPVRKNEAMIREVHVYGRAVRIGNTGTATQHTGLGKALVQRACEIAQNKGYDRINVISSVGTRIYYRKLGFVDNGLYQTREL